MIEALRFVDRDGRKRLQMATEATVKDGEIVYRWVDVPYVPTAEEEKG
jgi:hypothetical protein